MLISTSKLDKLDNSENTNDLSYQKDDALTTNHTKKFLLYFWHLISC